ncbi:hypothetical protein MtrunA17_Chr3g0085461 [Medicago truncatula]|uniref:Uncharacterized protein n=1 Tax=Medicago truncatula TaxID=3880 RepID=A0A396IJU6_MEDTR|nr:hypothetical protein MtrunA17_Chr3g0085461 [Medicago truncatula]
MQNRAPNSSIRAPIFVETNCSTGSQKSGPELHKSGADFGSSSKRHFCTPNSNFESLLQHNILSKITCESIFIFINHI